MTLWDWFSLCLLIPWSLLSLCATHERAELIIQRKGLSISEAAWNGFCQTVIPHEDSHQPGKSVYYFWGISCLWLCALYLVSLRQRRYFEIGSGSAGGSAASFYAHIHTHTPAHKLCFSDWRADRHFLQKKKDNTFTFFSLLFYVFPVPDVTQRTTGHFGSLTNDKSCPEVMFSHKSLATLALDKQ